MHGVGVSGRSILLALALLVAVAPSAGARDAYVTGTFESGGSGVVVPIDLRAESPGVPIEIGGEGPPSDVAISPDGRTAYVQSVSLGLTPVDVATNTAKPSIPGTVGSSVAIAPDGRSAYVTDRFADVLVPVDLVAEEAGTPIPVGALPSAVAITPDGGSAYVANLISNNVTPIDLTTQLPGTPIALPEIGGEGFEPNSIGVTPDGSRLFVVGNGGGAVSIDVATHAVGAPIPLPGSVFHRQLAITPDGSRVYVVDSAGNAFRIDAASGAVGPAVPLENSFLADIAILPSGASAYATVESEDTLAPLALATDTPGSPFFAIDRASAIAIVPNQPPRAIFEVQLPSVPAGLNIDVADENVYFDALGSTDPDGSVARYDWDFGDGTAAADAGPTTSHRYSAPGTYTVTLTVTDDEGCSLHFVFTGQTAYCNGSAVARTTRTVTVAEKPTSPCPATPKGTATGFTPKFRPARTQPGVRVRLSASQPSQLTVNAQVIYNVDGDVRRRNLDTLVTTVNRWRRVRFVLPTSIRDELPLGKKVKVLLKIQTLPRGREDCTARISHRTVRAKVVKVIPGAVQRGRLP